MLNNNTRNTVTVLGLPAGKCNYSNARVVILPCPYQGTVSYLSGTAGGPRAIIEATAQLELYDQELDLVTHERVPLACVCEPDLPIAAGPEAVVNAIEIEVRKHLSDGKTVFCLGGEHSITIGAAKAYADYQKTMDHHGEDLSFLHIDAHLDLRNSYQGNVYSHACVGTHLSQLGALVPVGVRVAATEEILTARKHSIQPMWCSDIYQSRTENGNDNAWISKVSARLGTQVYITLDVDGIDPSIIPSTGTPVPGGIDWYPLLQLLKTIGKEHNVVGCDLVELIPGHTPSTFTAAMLMKKMIGYFWA